MLRTQLLRVRPGVRAMRPMVRAYVEAPGASQQAQQASQQAPPPLPPPRPPPGATAQPKKGMRISYLFGGLIGIGLLATTYGILEYYYSLQIWPEPIRTPLKKAIKAKYHSDFDKAETYFNEALALAHEHPASLLAPDPLQKLSGIYISLATMQESMGNPVRAFSSLTKAYDLFGASPLAETPAPAEGWYAGPLEPQDVTRAIGLAQKLGTLAARLGGEGLPPPCPTNPSGNAAREWDLLAEKYLSSAVTAMLRLGLKPEQRAESQAAAEGGPAPAKGPVVIGRDVTLPQDGDEVARVNTKGLGMTMEALAEVYGRRERPDLAGHLLLQAISAVMPPTVQEADVAVGERCHAAMLMTAVSSYALAPRTEKAMRAARSWSLRALQVADKATADAGWTGRPVDADAATCARAQSVALFNLGMLAEMNKDPEAEKYFTASYEASTKGGFGEGRREAGEALKRIQEGAGAGK